MKQSASVWGMLLGVLTVVPPLHAQDGLINKGFLAVSFGAQSSQHDLEATTTPTIYDETATINTSQPIHNGPVLDIGAGYRVWPNVTLGARFSTFGFGSRKSTSTVTASIPDPVAYDRPRVVVKETPDLTHSEQGIHVQATWFHAVTPRLHVALAGGPSFIIVHQQLAATVAVPPGTQTITVTSATQTGTALGYNAGLDATFMFTPDYGFGVFGRYAAGTVDLPAASGVKVGGLQSGVGIKVRF